MSPRDQAKRRNPHPANVHFTIPCRSRRIEGQAMLKAFGSVVKYRRGEGYIRLRFKENHRYVGVVPKDGLFPDWPLPNTPEAATSRCFLRAQDARDWGAAVHRRYLNKSRLYWQEYFKGVRGWFRRIRYSLKARKLLR